MMFNAPGIPFTRDGSDPKALVRLTGPAFLSCGCGTVIARWASVQQNLATKLPQAKPKAARIVNDWLEQNGLKDKWPVLKQRQYGIVVAETEDGFEMVNIMSGAAPKVAEQIAQLLKRSKNG